MRLVEVVPFSLVVAKAGYTLHEILIAMALISIGVLGLAINTSGVIQGNYRSGTLTVATNLAQDKIEELKARTTLTNVNNCSSLNPVSEPAETNITSVGAPGGIFDRCWSIEDSVFGAGLKQVDVTVSWSGYEQRRVTLSTLLYGP
jgi:prepilin-type N-terminal cleavage/methylation domain-containing protein